MTAIMKPSRYYELARHIFHCPPSGPGMVEAAWRTAASRAYYAAFLLARSCMRRWGCSFRGDYAAHSKVIGGLDFSGVPSLREVADALGKLEHLRTEADYQPETPFAPEWAEIERYHARSAGALDACWDGLSNAERARAVSLMQAKIDATGRR